MAVTTSGRECGAGDRPSAGPASAARGGRSCSCSRERDNLNSHSLAGRKVWSPQPSRQAPAAVAARAGLEPEGFRRSRAGRRSAHHGPVAGRMARRHRRERTGHAGRLPPAECLAPWAARRAQFRAQTRWSSNSDARTLCAPVQAGPLTEVQLAEAERAVRSQATSQLCAAPACVRTRCSGVKR